jgi:hypothetical protein
MNNNLRKILTVISMITILEIFLIKIGNARNYIAAKC